MREFSAPRVDLDRVRVEAIVGSKRYSMDILVDDLADQVMRWKALTGHDAARLAMLRGTDKGSEIVMAAMHRWAEVGDRYEVLLGVLWGMAHAPMAAGWSALDDLGGRIVRAQPVAGRGWRIDLADPAE
jgi:hypothetical protein